MHTADHMMFSGLKLEILNMFIQPLNQTPLAQIIWRKLFEVACIYIYIFGTAARQSSAMLQSASDEMKTFINSSLHRVETCFVNSIREPGKDTSAIVGLQRKRDVTIFLVNLRKINVKQVSCTAMRKQHQNPNCCRFISLEFSGFS